MKSKLDLKQIYQDMETELIFSMKRNLSRHLKEEKKTGFEFTQWQSETLKEMKRFQRENKEIVDNYTSSLNEDIKKQLQEELKQGSKRELIKYKEIMGDKYKSNINLAHSFFKLNDRKLVSLINEVQNGTNLANFGVLRMMDDQYRKVISKAVMFSNHGVVSPKKAIDMATKDFLNAGINCIEYKDGRRVNIADYCDMAVRTANTRAQLIGEGQFRQEIGEHLVKPTKHNTSCEKCSKWEGKVLIDDVYSGGSKKDGKYPLLSEAMNQGFFHPRCEHSLPTYYKEMDDIKFDENGATEETLKKNQETLNWINNNIRRFERLVVGSLDESNIKEYQRKKVIYENKKEEILKETLPYKDVAKEWLDNVTPNSHKVVFDNYFIDDNGIRHPIVGKEVVQPIPTFGDEVDRANWLKKVFGGEIHLIPRITDISNNQTSTRTPDFRWNGKKWDLKTPTTKGEFNTSIERFMKKKDAKLQAKKFIIDFKNYKDVADTEIIKLAEKTLKSPYRNWIEDLMLVKGEKIIKIYSKK